MPLLKKENIKNETRLTIEIIKISLTQIKNSALAFLLSLSSTIADYKRSALIPANIAVNSKNNLNGAKSSGP